MTEINLLPWRELKREQEKKKFLNYLLGAIIIAGLLLIVVNRSIVEQNDSQSLRNKRIESEIQTFKKQITEIKNLKVLRQGLIARMRIVQDLQATRTLTVRLFDELIKILPDGVYVTRVERKGDRVTLTGFTESNSNISLLMRNIESSQVIQAPQLTEIKNTKIGVETPNEFKLSFILKPKVIPG